MGKTRDIPNYSAQQIKMKEKIRQRQGEEGKILLTQRQQKKKIII